MVAARIDVHHVAKLASLSLTEAEAVRFGRELEAIVAFVAQLDALDTSDVPATAHIELDRLPLRPDTRVPCLSNEEALAQAPSVESAGFAVPPFVS